MPKLKWWVKIDEPYPSAAKETGERRWLTQIEGERRCRRRKRSTRAIECKKRECKREGERTRKKEREREREEAKKGHGRRTHSVR